MQDAYRPKVISAQRRNSTYAYTGSAKRHLREPSKASNAEKAPLQASQINTTSSIYSVLDIYLIFTHSDISYGLIQQMGLCAVHWINLRMAIEVASTIPFVRALIDGDSARVGLHERRSDLAKVVDGRFFV